MLNLGKIMKTLCKILKDFNSTMGEDNDWDVEEIRTKYESEEHWKLKKDFMLAHKEKFNKERLKCLAQIFVNVQLMRCKYPDQVMRQVAELSKDIGLDYKTIQRERLQRTFVNASVAAAEKVKKELLKKKEVENEVNSVVNRLFKSTLDTCLVSRVSQKVNSASQIMEKKLIDSQSSSFSDECLNPNELYLYNIFLVSRNFAKFTGLRSILNEAMKFSGLEMERPKTYFSIENLTCILTTKLKGQVIKLGEAVHTERKIVLRNARINAIENLLKKCFTIEIKKNTFHMVYQIIRNNSDIRQNLQKSNSQNSSEEKNIDSNKVESESPWLMDWSEGEVEENEDEIKEMISSEEKNIGRNKIDSEMPKFMGCSEGEVEENEDEIKEMISSSEEKNIDSNNVDSERPTLLGWSGGRVEKNENEIKETISAKEISIDSNNIGAKILALMGWSGGGLGKNEDGIIEPVSLPVFTGRKGIGFKEKEEHKANIKNNNNLSTGNDVAKQTAILSELSNLSICDVSVEEPINIDIVKAKMFKLSGLPETELGKNVREIKESSLITQIGCEDLGITENENSTTKIFKIKVKSLLDQVKNDILTTVEGVMKVTIFSSKLSNVQRKYIHLLVANPEYNQQLQTKSKGGKDDRHLILKAKEDPRRLCCYLLLQGGSTEKYQIHKPGTLTVNYFLPQN